MGHPFPDEEYRWSIIDIRDGSRQGALSPFAPRKESLSRSERRHCLPAARKKMTRPLTVTGVYIPIDHSPTEERMRKMTAILGLFVGGLCLAGLANGQQG